MNFFLYIAFVALLFLRPVEAFAPELQEYRPMVVLGLVALAAATAESLLSGRNPIRKRCLVLILTLLGCISLSLITQGFFGGALIALSDFSISAILFILTILNVTSVSRLRITLVTILLATLVLSVAGLAAYHYGFMADRLVLGQRIGEGSEEAAGASDVPAEDTSGAYLWRVRSLGFLSDPNDFAQVIVMVLPLLGIWYRPRRHFRNLIVIGPAGAAFLYTIVLTHSRGAMMGLAALLFFGVRSVLGTVKTAILSCVLMVAATAANIAGGRGFSTDDESAGGRILAWSEGLTMLRYRPFFGVGYNRFTEYHHLTAHNSFVLCFAELGLIGYFVWLALLVTAFIDVNRVTDLSGEGDELECRPYAAFLAARFPYLCILLVAHLHSALVPTARLVRRTVAARKRR